MASCSQFVSHEEEDEDNKAIEANKTSTLQTNLLLQIKTLREDHPEMCDITFEVGRDPDRRQTISANSTILALASPYFKALCFGPMKTDTAKIIPDVDPDIFLRILNFVHGGNESIRFKCTEEAWQTRSAARQYLIEELVEFCDAFLNSRLTYKTALVMLSQAAEHKADEFKRSIFKVMKNRHVYICSSPDLKYIDVPELIDLTKLYKNISKDFIVKAIFYWGESLDDDEKFREVFKTHLFKHIKWENLSNENMIKIHDLRVMSVELENEVMLKLLAKSSSTPEENQKSTCILQLFLSKNRGVKPIYISRLFVRTLNAYKGLHGSWSQGDECLVLDNEGMGMLREVLKNKKLPGYHIDNDDVELHYSKNHDGKMLVEDLKVTAYNIVHNHKDVWYFEMTFKPFLFGEKPDPTTKEDEKGVNSLMFEASFVQELFLDLADFAPIQTNTMMSGVEKADTRQRKLSGPVGPMEVLGKSWQTKVADKAVLSNDDINPKYFYQEGAGIPIFTQIN